MTTSEHDDVIHDLSGVQAWCMPKKVVKLDEDPISLLNAGDEAGRRRICAHE
jgi:hypothetical protein